MDNYYLAPFLSSTGKTTEVFRKNCGHLTYFFQNHVGGPLLTCLEKGHPLPLSKECESARVRLR